MGKRAKWLAFALALALGAAACGDDDDTAAEGDDGGGSGSPAADCTLDDSQLASAGVLTVATGEPVFEPWMVDDDPTNGQGFEGGVVAELATRLGFDFPDQVEFVRTGFDDVISPGDKDWDFNIQQFGISADRDEVVDFSIGYYTVEQAIVGAADSDIASATSIADLKGYQLGAAIGTTSLSYIEDVIQPDSQPLAFDDNAAAKSSFDAGQVDGIVFDLPTAFYVTAVEIEGSAIVGVLPVVGEAEELGLLFEDGSPLVACINVHLQAMRDDGTLSALEDEWLNQGGDVPTLSE